MPLCASLLKTLVILHTTFSILANSSFSSHTTCDFIFVYWGCLSTGLSIHLVRVQYDPASRQYVSRTYLTSKLENNKQEIEPHLLPSGGYRIQVVDLNFNTSYARLADNSTFELSAFWFQKSTHVDVGGHRSVVYCE